MTHERATLTSRQHSAIDALMHSKTVMDAAVMACVSRKTLYRWLSVDAFVMALRDAQRQAIDASIRRLSESSSSAVDTLIALCDKSDHDGIRLAAANSILARLIDLRSHEEFSRRLDDLEKHEQQH